MHLFHTSITADIVFVVLAVRKLLKTGERCYIFPVGLVQYHTGQYTYERLSEFSAKFVRCSLDPSLDWGNVSQ